MRCSECGAEMTPLLPRYLLPPLCPACIKGISERPPPATPPPEPVEFRQLMRPGQLGLFGQVGERRRSAR